jgi:hypothetical protein
MSLLGRFNDKLEHVKNNCSPWVFVLAIALSVITIFTCGFLIGVEIYEVFQTPLIAARIGDFVIAFWVCWILIQWTKD